MTSPFLLAQLTDPHIGAEEPGVDPVARLRAAVRSVLALPSQPDALLVSGDLVEHATDAEYEQVRELLAPLEMPQYVLPGNHDDRDALHRHFGVPGAGGRPVQYSVDFGPFRLVVVDSTRPGEDPGALDAGRLDWLDSELAAAPQEPTLLAMHHPPLITGVAAWDTLGLPRADRDALGEVLKRHPQVRRVVAGHIHSQISAELVGRPVLTLPSTFIQLRLDLGSSGVELVPEPAAFALHTCVEGELISYVQPVQYERP